jgi:hypothetical protein
LYEERDILEDGFQYRCFDKNIAQVDRCILDTFGVELADLYEPVSDLDDRKDRSYFCHDGLDVRVRRGESRVSRMSSTTVGNAGFLVFGRRVACLRDFGGEGIIHMPVM